MRRGTLATVLFHIVTMFRLVQVGDDLDRVILQEGAQVDQVPDLWWEVQQEEDATITYWRVSRLCWLYA